MSKDGKTLYLHVLDWPESGLITLEGLPAKADSVAYLAGGEEAKFVQEETTLTIALPDNPLDEYDSVFKVQFTESDGEG